MNVCGKLLGKKGTIREYFIFFLIVSIAINAISLFTDVMDQDSALYAWIAKTMTLSGDWVNMFSYGEDWLDKPHLPFWITALSFKIFGITAFAYKLPSFLICILGVFYLYKLAKLFCGERTAQVSSIIYLVSLHVLLANFDVRAEGYLTTFIFASLYYIYKTYKFSGIHNIILASIFAAAAVMTKGIFVLITICGGFIIYWITTKQFKELINWRYWLTLLLTLLFITPELYCLYTQFDLHPEKTVFGTQNVSGLKFFFWDSQFGRFFNTGPIKSTTKDISFFAHTTIWAFLPWSIALIMGLIAFVRRLRQQLAKEIMILVYSALLTFLLFSLSEFQLPHYIVILFPHFAIFTAMYLISLRKETPKRILTWMLWVTIALIVGVIILLMIVFPFFSWWFVISVALIVLLALIVLRKAEWVDRFLWRGICFSALCSVFFTFFIYGTVLEYNAGMNAAKWINKNCPNQEVVMLNSTNHSMAFYVQSPVERAGRISIEDFTNQNQDILIFCPLSSMDNITQDIDVEILKEFDYFRITMLTPKFISSKSRDSEIDKYVVARCSVRFNEKIVE